MSNVTTNYNTIVSGNAYDLGLFFSSNANSVIFPGTSLSNQPVQNTAYFAINNTTIMPGTYYLFVNFDTSPPANGNNTNYLIFSLNVSYITGNNVTNQTNLTNTYYANYNDAQYNNVSLVLSGLLPFTETVSEIGLNYKWEYLNVSPSSDTITINVSSSYLMYLGINN